MPPAGAQTWAFTEITEFYGCLRRWFPSSHPRSHLASVQCSVSSVSSVPLRKERLVFCLAPPRSRATRSQPPCADRHRLRLISTARHTTRFHLSSLIIHHSRIAMSDSRYPHSTNIYYTTFRAQCQARFDLPSTFLPPGNPPCHKPSPIIRSFGRAAPQKARQAHNRSLPIPGPTTRISSPAPVPPPSPRTTS